MWISLSWKWRADHVLTKGKVDCVFWSVHSVLQICLTEAGSTCVQAMVSQGQTRHWHWCEPVKTCCICGLVTGVWKTLPFWAPCHQISKRTWDLCRLCVLNSFLKRADGPVSKVKQGGSSDPVTKCCYSLGTIIFAEWDFQVHFALVPHGQMLGRRLIFLPSEPS